jgi:GNAT superfamily N-acetyltransferase
MTVKIIPFNENYHKSQFRELIIEFIRWSHEQILTHHGVDMSNGSGNPQEYVESMVDELAALKPPTGFVLVLESKEKLVGMGLIKTIGEGIGEVKRMFILPEHRGRGYGKELMHALVARAEELDYSILRLETADFMPAALKVYRAAGFKERGEYPGGEVPEWYRPYCIFMEKKLTSEQA